MLGLLGDRIGLVVGGLVAGAAASVESLSVDPAVAAVGLALEGAGASLFWPLVMSQATVQASRPTAASGPSPPPASSAGWPAPRSSAGSPTPSGRPGASSSWRPWPSWSWWPPWPNWKRRPHRSVPGSLGRVGPPPPPTMILPSIETPADLRALGYEQLDELSAEIRAFIVETVTTTGGHLGSNLGVVELTVALHRVFDSPRDAMLWDTGHQAYVHKLLTGRRYRFRDLKKEGGLSGYPNRAESEHDWIENSHASTALSYAHGLASAFELEGEVVGHGGDRRVVAVVGDGALTGGMAYEALNNLGHSGRRVVVVLNDNGRCYAPTVSHLSQSLTSLRLNPTYVQTRERLRNRLRDMPAIGELADRGSSA